MAPLSSSPSSPSPSPRPRTPSSAAAARPAFYHLSSLSELELANLTLADMFEARHSQIADDELDSLPPLGQSVVEEAEERFQQRAHEALVFVATPAPSAPSSPTSSAPRPTPSSGARLRPPPAYASSDAADPSYFALSRSALYSDGGDSSYSTTASSASTPSLWGSAHSPTLSGASSAFTSWGGTPADSAACSPLGPRSPANGLVLAAAGADASLDSALVAEDCAAKHPSPPAKATIAARRAGAASGALALSLPLPPLRGASSFSALRRTVQGGGSKSPAAPAALSHLSAPSSPSRGGARATEGGKPGWVRELEVRAGEVQDGVRLRKKRSTGFAF
ncbi:hypothetical protein JCM10450v2_001692 [Rhodotorula kratochvilovae]